MKDITLYGAGGHCYAIIELIKSLNNYNPIHILDDDPKQEKILDIPVLKPKNDISPKNLCISIGNNKNRKKIATSFNVDFPLFIHKSAVHYPSTSIGKGTVVLPNAVLDADSKIGDFCIVNNNATISHNVILGNFVHIAINVAIAGGVKVDEGALIGAGSVVLPNIKIGKWAIVGAGAVVTKDVPDYATVIGNPAIIIEKD